MTSSPNAMIAVRDLIFDYSGKRALHGVSFEVPSAAVIALVGPNGAGKTTLLRCIAGLQEPLAGSVSVAGVDVTAKRRESNRRLGYLSDFFGLYDSLSGRQCLLYMAWGHGLRGEAADQAVIRAADRTDIGPHLNASAGTLSRGLRQRLAIAMALVHEPAVLLLDEPGAGLDPEARQSLARLLTQLRQEGTTLVVSSHQLSELEDYSSEMLVLARGRIVERCPVRAADTRSFVLDVVGDQTTALTALRTVDQLLNVRVEAEGIVFECDADKQFLAQLLASLVRLGVGFAGFRTPAWIACSALSLLSGVAIAVICKFAGEPDAAAPAISVVLALLVVRDAGLLVALRLRGGALASDAWCIVFCVCLHVLAPLIVVGIQATALRSVFTLDPKGGWRAVPILLCEILLVVQWIRMLWSRQRQAA